MNAFPATKWNETAGFIHSVGRNWSQFLRELNDPAIVAMALFSLTFFPHSICFGNIPILKGAEMIEHSPSHVTLLFPCLFWSYLTCQWPSLTLLRLYAHSLEQNCLQVPWEYAIFPSSS